MLEGTGGARLDATWEMDERLRKDEDEEEEDGMTSRGGGVGEVGELRRSIEADWGDVRMRGGGRARPREARDMVEGRRGRGGRADEKEA